MAVVSLASWVRQDAVTTNQAVCLAANVMLSVRGIPFMNPFMNPVA